MSHTSQRSLYEKLALLYPDRPYGGSHPGFGPIRTMRTMPYYSVGSGVVGGTGVGGKRKASAAQKKAAASNPWLKHVAAVRKALAAKGYALSPTEVVQYARQSYKKPGGAGRKAKPKQKAPAVKRRGGLRVMG